MAPRLIRTLATMSKRSVVKQKGEAVIDED